MKPSCEVTGYCLKIFKLRTIRSVKYLVKTC